jgi:hypothetical protein
VQRALKPSLVWALERGSRSGRVAYQFARDWAGRDHSKDETMPPSPETPAPDGLDHA